MITAAKFHWGDLRKVPHSRTQQQRSACRFVIPSPEPLDYLLSIDPEEAPRGLGLNTLKNLISSPHLPAVRRLGSHRHGGVGSWGGIADEGISNTPPPSRCGCVQRRGAFSKTHSLASKLLLVIVIKCLYFPLWYKLKSVLELAIKVLSSLVQHIFLHF